MPYRSGLQWRPKYANSRTVTLVMWTVGIDQASGNPGTDQRLSWNDNWNTIRKAFWNRGSGGSQQGTLVRQWFITQSSPQMVTASAMAEIAGSMEPTMTGRTRATFSVDLLLSDPYFYGAQQSQTLAYNTGTTVTNLGEGVVGESFSSSVCGFTLKLNGPLTSPTLTNSTAGVSVTYGANIASGHYVLLDVLNYTALSDTSVNNIQFVGHAGSRMWMCLLPGNNTLALTSLNGGDTGTCQLVWNPPYL